MPFWQNILTENTTIVSHKQWGKKIREKRCRLFQTTISKTYLIVISFILFAIVAFHLILFFVDRKQKIFRFFLIKKTVFQMSTLSVVVGWWSCKKWQSQILDCCFFCFPLIFTSFVRHFFAAFFLFSILLNLSCIEKDQSRQREWEREIN